MMARLEKRSFFTFVSKIYQREIKLNCSDSTDKPKEIPSLYHEDIKLKQSVADAVLNPNLEIEAAQNLLRELAGKVRELETRLTDYEDTS